MRGITNTRMRDFYDIFILTTTQSFDSDTFKAALRNTTSKRGAIEQVANTLEAIIMVGASALMVALGRSIRAQHQKKICRRRHHLGNGD